MLVKPKLPTSLGYIAGSDAGGDFRGRLGYTLKDYLAEAGKANNAVVVRRTAEGIVGVAWVEREGDRLIVHHLETDDRFEGGGVGTELLVAIEKRIALTNGVNEIALDALEDDELIAWYKRRGFAQAGVTRDEPGYGRIVPMRKKLA
ncbi:MAG: GNAT family N-acetyltransferase [Candidatus Thermoplasmatota archaeon]